MILRLIGLRSWSKISQLFRQGVSLEGRSWALCGVQTLRRLTGSLSLIPPKKVYHCTILICNADAKWKAGLGWLRTCLNHIKQIDVEKDCLGNPFTCYKRTNFNLYIVHLGRIMMDYVGKIYFVPLSLYDPISA